MGETLEFLSLLHLKAGFKGRQPFVYAQALNRPFPQLTKRTSLGRIPNMNLDPVLDKAIRKVPDFPKKGILYYDITGILTNPKVFHYCLDKMAALYKGEKIDAVAAIESRGFIFAAPFADRLGIPLILIRKKGKLPGETYSCSYSLEYGEATVEVHKSDVIQGQRILLMDDLIATGGTLHASRSMLQEGGATVIGFFGVIALPFLHYEKLIGDLPIKTLIQYESE
ncbi:putative adenine phosphoribosyltransferase [Treponema phagedenis F0421]|nr:putative adenine phosphoribosyltransferase [Treponema phagedenis F0421]